MEKRVPVKAHTRGPAKAKHQPARTSYNVDGYLKVAPRSKNQMKRILEAEQYLNSDVSIELFRRFKLGSRFHVVEDSTPASCADCDFADRNRK